MRQGWCQAGLVPSPLPITACRMLRSAAGPQECLDGIDRWLGDAWEVERLDERIVLARCGSRTAYRLLGSWISGSRLPMQVRFEAAPTQVGTVVTVTMSSHEGRYVLNAPRVRVVYQARFAQLLAELADQGFTPVEPAGRPRGD